MKKLLLFLCLIVSAPILAQFCSPLDPAFGQNGLAVNFQLQLKNSYFFDRHILRQGTGGKIFQFSSINTPNNESIVIQRYLSNGQKDPGFGSNGIRIYDTTTLFYWLQDGVNLADGGCLLVGSSYGSSVSSGWVARLNELGAEDFTFRLKAKENMLIRDDKTQLQSVAELPDGRILIAASMFREVTVCDAIGLYPRVFLTCLNPDGSTDINFGVNGVLSIESGSVINQNPVILLQENGKFLLASETGAVCSCVTDAYYGTVYLGCNRQDLLIRRFDFTGAADLTFGNQGKILDSSGSFSVVSMLVQPDSKILALGGGNYPRLRRYLPDGSRDASFGILGEAEYSALDNVNDAESLRFSGFAMQEDGKIMVVGSGNRLNEAETPLFVRFNQQGFLDTSFSKTGWVEVLESGKRADGILYSISNGNGQLVVGGARATSSGLPELFVAAVSRTDRRIYPEIAPKGEVVLCYNDSVKLSTGAAGTYQWYKNNEPLLFSTASSINLKNATGAYALIVVNASGCGQTEATRVISRQELYPGIIQWTGTELVANGGFVRYQWYLDNVLIPGATSVRYSPGTALGSYAFRGWDQYDCSVLSSAFPLVITGVSDLTLGDAQIRFFPNPVRSTLIIQHRSNSLQKASFELYDETGRKLLQKILLGGRNTIDLQAYKSGMYNIILRNGNDFSVQKLMILRD